MLGGTSNRNSFPYIYRGVVLDNVDPLHLGRCKIKIPSLHGDAQVTSDMLSWSRPITQTPIGLNRGSVNIPQINDIVWVLFEGGDKESPIYIGGTYGEGDIENLDPENIILYQEEDMLILWSRSTKQILLKQGDTLISIDNDNICINAKESISLTSNNSIQISSPHVLLQGDTLELKFSHIQGLEQM